MATENLAAALAQVQANLPAIVKGETATVPTKAGGKYSYSYADLADVSAVILPMLGKVGLSWITKPTFNADGKFVLAYKLLHVSGDTEVGEYPLSGGTPQEIGSAITYARRYALCAVTGVAPAADDDDGAAAAQHAQRERFEDARPARPDPAEVRRSVIGNARKAIAEATEHDALDDIGKRLTAAEQGGHITGDDAVELRRRLVARIDALFPAGEQSAVAPVDGTVAAYEPPSEEKRAAEQVDLGGEWPPARKPGSGDPA